MPRFVSDILILLVGVAIGVLVLGLTAGLGSALVLDILKVIIPLAAAVLLYRGAQDTIANNLRIANEARGAAALEASREQLVQPRLKVFEDAIALLDKADGWVLEDTNASRNAIVDDRAKDALVTRLIVLTTDGIATAFSRAWDQYVAAALGSHMKIHAEKYDDQHRAEFSAQNREDAYSRADELRGTFNIAMRRLLAPETPEESPWLTPSRQIPRMFQEGRRTNKMPDLPPPLQRAATPQDPMCPRCNATYPRFDRQRDQWSCSRCYKTFTESQVYHRPEPLPEPSKTSPEV